jgi:hypothetical protein
MYSNNVWARTCVRGDDDRLVLYDQSLGLRARVLRER